jgi:hypothetical protein
VIKPDVTVLVLSMLLVVAAANTPALSSTARSLLILLALVASILASLRHQGIM